MKKILLISLFIFFVSDKTASALDINLKPGWNTVKWPSSFSFKASQFPSSCPLVISRSQFFLNIYIKAFSPLDFNMEANKDYLVKCNTAAVISSTLPTSPPLASPAPKAYTPPAPVNYAFYEWKNDDLNSKYPQGAPWGSLPVFPWKDIHPGDGQFDFSVIDNYIGQATRLNKPVILEIGPYESMMPGRNPIPSSYRCDDSAKRIYPLFYDLTPEWLRAKMGGSYYIPLDGKEGRQFCSPVLGGGSNYDPAYCYALAFMPKYDHPEYQKALKDLIFALGRKYNDDPRVSAVVFAQGLDAEFGNSTKGGWGDCGVRAVADKLGYTRNYYSLFVKEGLDNDYTDWYATAFSKKPVYHQITSDGKSSAKVMMDQGYPNLGIKQATVIPDHNWLYTNGHDGILDIVEPWIGKRPIAWENAVPPMVDTTERTKNQQAYAMMLFVTYTFPDFFDFVGGMCFGFQEECNWARQYYGRTPESTQDIWIAFFQTNNTGTGGTMNFRGFLRDYEYGLKLVSTKGKTIWRQNYNLHPEPGLKELFNQEVADAYSGQARLVNLNETIVLAPVSVWKGLSAANPTYDLEITFVNNSGKFKVEVGESGNWQTQEFDRTNTKKWQKQTFSINKKASQIKITPTSGDPLYMHMVRLILK